MIYLWDVKSWKLNLKRLDLTFQISEFNLGSFGLGVEWYYNGSPAINRYDNYAHLILRLAWVEFSIYGQWGKKQQHLAAMRRARERLIAMAQDAKLSE